MSNSITKLTWIHRAGSCLAVLFVSGCASTYQIHSTPEGALVSYQAATSGEQPIYLGTTPLAYSKSSLPSDKAFLLTVKKEGFLPVMVPLMPTDESNTSVVVNLKPDEHGPSSTVKEWNDAILKLFDAQSLIYRRQFHAAVLGLDKLIQNKPDLIEAYILKGTAFYLLNEVESALAAWRIALKLDPGNPEVLRFLDEMKVPLKKLEEKP